MKTSKNEQDYLKAIYSLKNENNGSVSINAIAQKLSVSSPSATEMIKRLAKKELVITYRLRKSRSEIYFKKS